MMRKRSLVFWVLLLVALFSFMGVSGGCGGSGGGESAGARLEDDYYASINADWLARTEIPPDKSRVTAFTEIEDEIAKTLTNDLENLAGESSEDPVIDMAAQYYAMFLDSDARNSTGFTPASGDFARIENVKSMDDISLQASSLIMDGIPTPFDFDVSPGQEDASRYALYATMADTFLGDPSYYEASSDVGSHLTPLMTDLLMTLFRSAGLNEAQSELEVKNAMKFDAILATVAPNTEEKNDFTLLKTIPFDSFTTKSKNVDLGAVVRELAGTVPGEIIVNSSRFYDSFDAICSPENLELMKSWMRASFLKEKANYLGYDDFLLPKLRYKMSSEGSRELQEMKLTALNSMSDLFGQAIGIYYGKKYFGEEARADVLKMIDNIIAVYRTRIENKDWLSGATKEKAIRKLDAMTRRVGYPDKLPPQYELYNFTPSPQGNLYSNTVTLQRAVARHQYSLFGKPSDRTLWEMNAYTVNAYYSPSDNSINFPAAILVSPFYSKDQSAEANLGAIGAVIGHEISHAFDSNGSLYDEIGNFKNWWTDEDRAKFNELTKAMVNLFDGIPYEGGKINGSLTLGENTADAGGISVALEAAKAIPDVSLPDFFKQWAIIWRVKMRPEFALRLLTEDVHSPGKLRVNVQLSNSDGFYDAYEIKETDEMYLAPEKRVNIW
jgi:putative endopeptidase